MKRKSTIILAFFMLALLAGIFSTVSAQDTQPTPQVAKPTPSDNEVNAVAKQMFCPVCENIPLDVCPTTACQEWRELIRQKLADGWTDQQIKDYFAAQYGDRVLSEPPRRGLNWLVYVVPPVIFLLGVGVVWSVMRSMRKAAVVSEHPDGQVAEQTQSKQDADPYLARLEEELRKKPE